MKNEVMVDNSSGLASVILGIMSISFSTLVFFSFLSPITGLFLGVISLIFAINQRKKQKNKWSKYGLILSIIGLVLNGIILIIMISFVHLISTQYEELCQLAGGCENIPAFLESQQGAYYTQ